MQFYVGDITASRQPTPQFPCLRLIPDGWNDWFTWITQYSLAYHTSATESERVGEVKILDKESSDTQLPETFTELGSRFCSLGQDIQFYSNLFQLLGSDRTIKVLNALNDLATSPGLLDEWEQNPGIEKSLFRNPSTKNVLLMAGSVIQGASPEPHTRFTFRCHIGESERDHLVRFDFTEYNHQPHRIIALVGRNGTGKTQYLAQLARALSGDRVSFRKLEAGEQIGTGITTQRTSPFSPYKPSFSRVIAVSCSAFDSFQIPTSDRHFSYRYCGIRTGGEFISTNIIQERFTEAIKSIREQNRLDDLYDLISRTLGNDFCKQAFEPIISGQSISIELAGARARFSSGENFLLFSLTLISASIRTGSLILFDEPELHLHPAAVTMLFKGLNHLLRTHDSFAIFATHSSLIIREIPRRFVRILQRSNNRPIVIEPEFETFGENLSFLTDTLFENAENTPYYIEVLEDLITKHSAANVSGLFQNRLGVNARLILAAKKRHLNQQ